jgi:SNF family Na+-dependent transporter
MIITTLDTFTSVFAGCTVFCFLGYLMYLTGDRMEDVAREGPGLAFVIYAEAISTFYAVPQVSGILYICVG